MIVPGGGEGDVLSQARDGRDKVILAHHTVLLRRVRLLGRCRHGGLYEKARIFAGLHTVIARINSPENPLRRI